MATLKGLNGHANPSIQSLENDVGVDVNPASGFAVTAIVPHGLHPTPATYMHVCRGLLTLDPFRVRFGFKF